MFIYLLVPIMILKILRKTATSIELWNHLLVLIKQSLADAVLTEILTCQAN